MFSLNIKNLLSILEGRTLLQVSSLRHPRGQSRLKQIQANFPESHGGPSKQTARARELTFLPRKGARAAPAMAFLATVCAISGTSAAASLLQSEVFGELLERYQRGGQKSMGGQEVQFGLGLSPRFGSAEH